MDELTELKESVKRLETYSRWLKSGANTRVRSKICCECKDMFMARRASTVVCSTECRDNKRKRDQLNAQRRHHYHAGGKEKQAKRKKKRLKALRADPSEYKKYLANKANADRLGELRKRLKAGIIVYPDKIQGVITVHRAHIQHNNIRYTLYSGGSYNDAVAARRNAEARILQGLPPK